MLGSAASAEAAAVKGVWGGSVSRSAPLEAPAKGVSWGRGVRSTPLEGSAELGPGSEAGGLAVPAKPEVGSLPWRGDREERDSGRCTRGDMAVSCSTCLVSCWDSHSVACFLAGWGASSSWQMQVP